MDTPFSQERYRWLGGRTLLSVLAPSRKNLNRDIARVVLASSQRAQITKTSHYRVVAVWFSTLALSPLAPAPAAADVCRRLTCVGGLCRGEIETFERVIALGCVAL